MTIKELASTCKEVNICELKMINHKCFSFLYNGTRVQVPSERVLLNVISNLQNGLPMFFSGSLVDFD